MECLTAPQERDRVAAEKRKQAQRERVSAMHTYQAQAWTEVNHDLVEDHIVCYVLTVIAEHAVGYAAWVIGGWDILGDGVIHGTFAIVWLYVKLRLRPTPGLYQVIYAFCRQTSCRFTSRVAAEN